MTSIVWSGLSERVRQGYNQRGNLALVVAPPQWVEDSLVPPWTLGVPEHESQGAKTRQRRGNRLRLSLSNNANGHSNDLIIGTLV